MQKIVYDDLCLLLGWDVFFVCFWEHGAWGGTVVWLFWVHFALSISYKNYIITFIYSS